MTTKTITITDLADVQAGDMVTTEYVPQQNEGTATISGIAYKCDSGALRLAGMMLRRPGGAHGSFQRFASATREVPIWEPPAELAAAFADNLARLWGSASAGAAYKEDTRQLLGWLHDSGWLKDSPTEPEPVDDPVLDETDKHDRFDCDGDKWYWSEGNAAWISNDDYAMGNLAALDRHYGPLRFANEETDK